MKTKKKHESSEKGKEDPHNLVEENKKYPGYPLYPESEDIMNPQNAATKVPLDDVSIELNEIPKPVSGVKKSGRSAKKDLEGAFDPNLADAEEPDDDELNNDGGDDDDLKKRTHPVDMSAKDLDIPGSELDDADEAIGEEDEENNPYSIGGDRHEDLEENTGKD